jgi:hypothetical protein
MDIAHMRNQPRFPVDLDDYEAVKSNAEAILESVSSKSMPLLPEGPWTDTRINLFQQWKDNGFPQ